MLCSTCSKRTSCKEICEEVESFLKKKKNYKLTYRKKEIAICEMAEDNKCFERYLRTYRKKERNGCIKNTTISHEVWMDIRNIIETKLTPKQRDNTISFLDGHSMESIGSKNGTSGQAVRDSIFGHPKQGGGAVRKIQRSMRSSTNKQTTCGKLLRIERYSV